MDQKVSGQLSVLRLQSGGQPFGAETIRSTIRDLNIRRQCWLALSSASVRPSRLCHVSSSRLVERSMPHCALLCRKGALAREGVAGQRK
jgi:hypothetical protein